MAETRNRGFAAMDQQKQRDIASKGGQSVPAEKRSFSQNHALAAAAGRKGGQSVPPEKRSFAQNHRLAAEAGRRGGESSGGSRGRREGGTPHQEAGNYHADASSQN